MTDQEKELVQLAALAADIECLGELGWRLPCGQTLAWWNPLEDDGDAFRLLSYLRLNLKVTTTPSSVFVNCYNDFTSSSEWLYIEGRNITNTNASYRKVIVNTASKIGKKYEH